MAQYILPLLADLSKGPEPGVGSASRRICSRAAMLSRQLPYATVCLATAHRKRDGVSGSKVMATYLREAGVPEHRILFADTNGCAFRTIGEIEAFVRFISARDGHDEVFVVARWWHIPRTYALLKKKLGTCRKPVTVHPVRTKSLELSGMAKEIIAWGKAFALKEV